MAKKIRMVQCSTRVRKDAISRKQINGVEHIIVVSYTLPDNVVMNGGLYPADEIAKSFHTLERTLAPVEHPVDSSGNFISASDPEAIHNFHAGAFNVDVTQENGRIKIAKHINVQEALKTDRGKRLLDRINEIETSDKPRPIHTSVGLFLVVEDLPKPMVNEAGDEYTWIGKDMVFDHDAILLDSIGAATPEKGVGMAINSSGHEVPVDRVTVNSTIDPVGNLSLADTDPRWDSSAAVRRVMAHIDGLSEADRTRTIGVIDNYLGKLKTNAQGQSFSSIMEDIQQSISGIVAADWIFLVDVFENEAIFETPQGYFSVSYEIREGKAVISGVPIRVDKTVEFQPKINASKGEERMKKLILNALAKAGVETDGLSDDELLAAYNRLAAESSQKTGDDVDTDVIGKSVSSAIEPLVQQINSLSEKVNAKDNEEKTALINKIVKSGKYPGLEEEAAKLLDVNTLKNMAANCGTSHGVPFTINTGESDNKFAAPTEMPE